MLGLISLTLDVKAGGWELPDHGAISSIRKVPADADLRPA